MPRHQRQNRTLWLRVSIRMLQVFLILTFVPLALLVSCQSKLIYLPRPYAAGSVQSWEKETQGNHIDFHTSQGTQRAFLQGNLKSPRNLWIVCGGNGTLALDWSPWLEAHASEKDAWLLVDFPGYGDCAGRPSPGHIRESLDMLLPITFEKLGWQKHPDPSRLRFFGHSLGCAACLLAATDFKIQRGVLISPFTSTMDMTRQVIGLPLGFLVWHRFDNSKRLTELTDRGPGKVIIFHGTSDGVIPTSMSRELAANHPTSVQLIEVPGGHHNDIQEIHAAEIAAALNDVGKP